MKKIIISTCLIMSAGVYAQSKQPVEQEKTKELKEVSFTKKAFQKKSDRFVYDVDASPVTKGSTVFELLKQTPMISSTDDKNLQIVGKNNAGIFINGRKSNMDAESLTQFLKNTPVENIQKIEVITTPGSEFQVEGSDGIINIILKKKASDGFNGNLRMGTAYNYYAAANAALSVNYRKDKLGVSASLMTNENIEVQKYVLKNGNSQGMNQSEGLVKDPNKNLGGYVNLDYELNSKSNLALSWNTWAGRSYGTDVNLLNTITSINSQNPQYIATRNTANERSYNNSVNLNYELKTDDEGSKLNLNAAYLNYRRFQNGENRTYFSDRFNNTLGLNTLNVQETPQLIDNFSFLGDYVQKLKNELTLSFGGNFNKTKTDNDFTNIIYQNNTTRDLSNQFVYDENIYGLYITLEKKFSDKFSGKIGTRYEITNSIGTSDRAQNLNLRRIEQNYSNLLPYVSVNYAFNDQNNISYAFSSRMRRPGFWELNPVINYLTEFNYTQNNPFVKASANYNSELTYMYKNSYFFVVNHSYKQDVITQVPLQGVINGVNQLRYIRTNFGDRQELSATVGMQKSFFKGILNSNFNIGLQHNRNKGSLSVDPITGDQFPVYENSVNSTSLLIQTNNTIRLDQKKTWFLGLNYFFVDKQQIELGQLKNLMSLDLNLRKTWSNWTFVLELKDVLRTNIVTITDFQQNGNFNYINQDRYNRSVRLNLTYNFGNQKLKKVRNIEGAEKEIKSRTN